MNHLKLGEATFVEIRKYKEGNEWETIERIVAYTPGVYSDNAPIEKLSKANPLIVYAIFQAGDRYTVAPTQVWFQGVTFSSVDDTANSGQIIQVGDYRYCHR